MQIDWDHVYLLGYYYPNGDRSLTSFDGYAPRVEVVVTGGARPPMWGAPVPPGLEVHPFPPDVPENKDSRIAYATSKDGLFAFGWYFEDGFEREPYRDV